MSTSLRLSEKWFNRGLWVVAIVFAGFLTGLGSVVVGDLPRVEQTLQRDSFIDMTAALPLRAAIDQSQKNETAANSSLEQAALKLDAAQHAYDGGRDTFKNWVATRQATNLSGQDAELVQRTRALDALKAAVSDAQQAVDAQQKTMLDAQQARAASQQTLEVLETAADEKLDAANRRVELRVFLYRLAVTLPLLLIAGWLFVRQRKSSWWPFVWGFILFALYAFFVELVPYLPSYGGYIRYIVGIIVTMLVGRYAIVALNRYLAQQKLIEAQPDKVRRDELSYDTALTRLGKGVCPGCERAVDLKNPEIDFCPHCGIGLFDHCATCTARKSAFSPFCPACGTAAKGAAPH